MSTNAIEQTTKANQETLMKNAASAEAALKTGGAALKQSSTDAMSSIQELAKAYQSVATRNAEKLSASLHSFAAVKTPAEFVTLQRKLMVDGVETAISDFSHIARLTSAVFIAALDPLQKQAAALKLDSH